MQSKKGSLIESITSTVVGFCMTILIQLTVFPLYGIHLELSQDLQIVGIFTIASIVRQYTMRRVFNFFTTSRVFNHDTAPRRY